MQIHFYVATIVKSLTTQTSEDVICNVLLGSEQSCLSFLTMFHKSLWTQCFVCFATYCTNIELILKRQLIGNQVK